MEQLSEDIILSGCKRKDRQAQKALYQLYFGYALKICLRYAKDREEALELVNDGFMKVFTKFHLYKSEYAIKSWIGRVMINTAIDHYRSKIKKQQMEELINANVMEEKENILSGLHYKDMIALVQKLSAAYRTVFNLFVIDGYSHQEIAQRLSISEGTSKSNLFKARQQLKEMILTMDNLKSS